MWNLDPTVGKSLRYRRETTMLTVVSVGLKNLKDEELETKIQELREEKTRLTEAFVTGKIPQDVYKKTVMRVETDIANVEREIKRRSTKK